MNLSDERVFLTEKIEKYQRALEVNYEEWQNIDKQRIRLQEQYDKYQ